LDATTLVLALIVSFGVWYAWAYRSGARKFWSKLEQANQENGTHFGDPRDLSYVVGADTGTGVLVFDPVMKKIAFVTQYGRTVEVLDYSFIRRWNLIWEEQTRTAGVGNAFVYFASSRTQRRKAVLVIHTNDLNRPIVRLSMSSMEYAEQASARLEILVNR